MSKKQFFINLVSGILPTLLRDKAESVAIEQTVAILFICNNMDESMLPREERLPKAAKDFCNFSTQKSMRHPRWLDLNWWEKQRSER